MNSIVPQSYIDARAAAEYGAQFRSDVEGYVQREIIEACTGDFREMLPASPGTCGYRAFRDPASGSGEYSFTLAIGHKAASTWSSTASSGGISRGAR